MQLFIKGHGIHVTDALRAYAEEKIGHLQHYFDHIIDAHVTMRTERAEQIVDVTLHLRHYIIKAEERSADMYASIDLVRDRLEQQIRKYKTRKIDRHHRANGKATLRRQTAEEPAESEERLEVEEQQPQDAWSGEL